ncbi:MAG: DUF4147 domain-containing protein [Promethearchaeia archaeon]
MIIKNYSQIINRDISVKQKKLRKVALLALEKAIESVKAKNLIQNAIKIRDNNLIIQNDKYDLNKYGKIIFIGGGKATAQMATALEAIISRNFKEFSYEGMINIPEGLELNKKDQPKKIVINYATHPLPNENGLRGVKNMIKLVDNAKETDLIITLISGGGSALLPLPKEPITIDELRKVNLLLLESGANIHEINTIRKHLSDFKGGNLARKVHESSGATLISLIISDVVGDDLDSIASGPTVPDGSTYKQAIDILNKYNLLNQIPHSAKQILEEGNAKKTLENPKSNDPCFKNTNNYLIGSVKSAVKNLQKYFSQNSFVVNYYSNQITGEAKDYAENMYKLIQKKRKEMIKNEIEKLVLIGSGELTVTIKGGGIGGRNQEMLLSLINIMKNQEVNYPFLILGANLDGIEGNSKAMGALIDRNVIQKAKDKDIQKYLKNNDSNSFFKKIGTEIITGPTGCNVNDIILGILR